MAGILSPQADFTPGSSNALALQDRLRPKLLEAGYVQEELVGNFCEFIAIMIGNAKTKEQINSELSELIGDEFDPSFTDWLFNEVDELTRLSQSNGIQDEQMDDSPRRQHLKGPPSSARSAAAPYPQPSRVVDQINRTLERSTGPVKHSIPDIPNVPTGPRAHSSAGPIRRGGGRGGVRIPMQPIPPNFAAFMGSMPPEFVQQMLVDAANYQQQMMGYPPMPLAERISDGSSGIVVAGGDRNRCRHWPRCQLGGRCKFHHPSQICQDYPNCPNIAGTCPNIHVGEDIPEGEIEAVVANQLGPGAPPNQQQNRPQSQPTITSNGHHPAPKRQNQAPKSKQQQPKPQEQAPLCKFGAMCTKPDCPFAHPTPAAGQDGLVLRGEMCPDGRDCLNQDCDMGHPSPAVEGVRRKETENCKFFPNCTNPECPYKHPAVSVQTALGIPCKFGVNCTRPNCVFNHEISIPCRYFPCLNEHCLFKHVEGQQPSKNKVWTPDSSGNGSLAERKFAVDQAEENIVVGSGVNGGQETGTAVHE